MSYLPYDPGVLPTSPAPVSGTRIAFEVEGLPPAKEVGRSIRNVSHPRYSAFVALRKAATAAMAGRAWSHGPVRLEVVVYLPSFESGPTLLDYFSGIEDTLDGCSGYTFTYLPIMFEDDCQVVDASSSLVISSVKHYSVCVEYL